MRAFAWCGVILSAVSIIACLGLGNLNEVYANQTQPFSVSWPSGWEVDEPPLAAAGNSRRIAGGRIRCQKKEQGQQVAAVAMDIDYIARHPRCDEKLNVEFAQAVAMISKSYEKSGYSVSTSGTENAKLGKLPALATEFTINGPGFTLKQWLGMALSSKYLFHVTYSGLKEPYEKYQDKLQECRNSLSIDP